MMNNDGKVFNSLHNWALSAEDIQDIQDQDLQDIQYIQDSGRGRKETQDRLVQQYWYGVSKYLKNLQC